MAALADKHYANAEARSAKDNADPNAKTCTICKVNKHVSYRGSYCVWCAYLQPVCKERAGMTPDQISRFLEYLRKLGVPEPEKVLYYAMQAGPAMQKAEQLLSPSATLVQGELW